MHALLNLESIPAAAVGPMDYVVFGGTFDPPHDGHISVIKRLSALFPLTIAAPTSLNPWKKDDPRPAPFGLRVQMLQLVLAAEGLKMTANMAGSGVLVCSKEYVYAEELVKFLRQERTGTLYWAVGEDIALTVPQWRNWHELGVKTVVVPVTIDTHSCEVRKGERGPHPVLAGFIEEYNLYK